MANSKQSERQRRYHARKKAQAMALFAHATEIELAWFGVNRDGEHIAIGYDSKPIDLVVRAGATLPETPKPEDSVDEVSVKRAAREKKVYAPKSWSASGWNEWVHMLHDIAEKGTTDVSKERVIANLRGWDKLNAKMLSQAVAVIEALPDVPDWYAHLPLAEES